MKANELMIGDWVYDTILQGFTRVKVLTARGIKGDIHDNIWDEDTFAPIPLTPEILEKNGFEVLGKRRYFLVPGDPSLAIERNGNLGSHGNTFTIGHFWDGEEDFRWFIEIDYVHELQHCLKLVGIEKEIEL